MDRTNWQFDGTQDTMDSRDIMERIEDLEGKRKPWIAGCNMPGFMPDTTPEAFADHSDAVEWLKETMRRHIEEDSEDESKAGLVQELEEALSGLEKLEETCEDFEFGRTANAYHYWIDKQPRDGLTPDEAEELAELKALEAEASSSPDWRYGEQLIRDSYFEEYAEQLIDDCYPDVAKALGSGDWPMRHLKLDIEDAAEELKQDYFDVTYCGVTYWIRS